MVSLNMLFNTWCQCPFCSCVVWTLIGQVICQYCYEGLHLDANGNEYCIHERRLVDALNETSV